MSINLVLNSQIESANLRKKGPKHGLCGGWNSKTGPERGSEGAEGQIFLSKAFFRTAFTVSLHFKFLTFH